jgi:hypothetical protein
MHCALCRDMSEHQQDINRGEDGAATEHESGGTAGGDEQGAIERDLPTRDHSLAAPVHDRALIPAIHEACDQWCIYCRATDRCLAFQSTNAAEVGGLFDAGAASAATGPDGERIGEGATFLKMFADAEGRLAPPEIEAVLSGNREQLRQVFSLDDPLERLGRRYMMLSEAYLQSRPDFPPPCTWRREGPTALEALAWYHVLVPARVFRAILANADARRGVRGRAADTLRAAKVALIGIDRSARAVDDLSAIDDDPRLDLLKALLRQLREAVDARFPRARGFVRRGLDAEPLPGTPFHRGLRRLRRLLHWPDGRPADAASGDLRGSARRAGPPRG